MTADLLPRHGATRPALTVAQDLAFTLGRVHELCGNARRTLAMMAAGAMAGPVFWIQPAWLPERLNGEAMAAFANPGRFLFLFPRRPDDLLWTMEEALRSGAVPLVVADLTEAPGLTPVRRLNLAAEAGAAGGKLRPLGLILTPGDGGAAGAESRWSLKADHGPSSGWRLSRRRARAAPPKDWRLVQAEGRIALADPPLPSGDPASAIAVGHRQGDV